MSSEPELVQACPDLHVAAAQTIIGVVARCLRGHPLPGGLTPEASGIVDAVRLLHDGLEPRDRERGRATLAAGVLAAVMSTLVAQVQADMRAPCND